MNLYVYIPTKDNLAYSQPIKASQVFFDGLKGEKIGKKFDAKIYIKDGQDIEGCFYAHRKNINGVSYKFICRNQQCCLHFWLLLEDPFEQLSGIVC